MKEAIESAHQDTVLKLQREIKQLKHINQDLQQKYQAKQQDYKDKVGDDSQLCAIYNSLLVSTNNNYRLYYIKFLTRQGK